MLTFDELRQVTQSQRTQQRSKQQTTTELEGDIEQNI